MEAVQFGETRYTSELTVAITRNNNGFIILGTIDTLDALGLAGVSVIEILLLEIELVYFCPRGV